MTRAICSWIIFRNLNLKTIEKVLDESAKAIETVLSDGIEKAMAIYN